MSSVGALRSIGIAIVGLSLLATSAGAAVLCRKKSGVVVVREDSCKKKESGLDLAQFGAVGGFRLFNGAGQSLGAYDIVDGIAVRSPVDGKLVEVYPNSDGLPNQKFARLYHGTADCGGPILVSEDDPKTLIRFGVVRNGRVYYPGDPITSQPYMSREQGEPSMSSPCDPPNFVTPRGLCCYPTSSGTESLGPAQTFDASVLGAGPFTIAP